MTVEQECGKPLILCMFIINIPFICTTDHDNVIIFQFTVIIKVL